MPKNPVRAAKQAGRQQLRAAKQTSKVAKIQNRTQAKLAKIQGSTPASTSAPAPKFKTAAELKSTIKMPDMGASLNRLAKASSIKNGTGTKAPAPVTKKSAPTKKSSPKPKANTPTPTPPKVAPTPKPKDDGPYIVSKEFDRQAKAAKENSKNTYITKPESRNRDQQIQVRMDKKKQIRKKLESFMPNKRMGGAMKGKKC
jgi:hypothetical protein